MASARSPIRSRDFALYLVAMVGARFAGAMAEVAIGWQVYAISGRALDLGLLGLAEFVPLLLLALPAGHLADRVPRRTLFAVMLVLQTAVFAGLAAVSAAGVGETWPYYALAFATGVAAGIGLPAVRSIVPQLVPPDLLPAAMAQRSAFFQAATVLGPVAGGLLFALAPVAPYLVAAALGVVGVVAVALLRAAREPAGGGAPSWSSVLAGVRLIRRTPVLLGAISLDLFAVLLGGAVALLPVFARDVLHTGPAGLGLLRASPALGALVAAVVLARRPVARHAGAVLLGAVALFGGATIVFGLSTSVPLSLAALAVAGAVDMVSVVLRSTIVPLVTPNELLGRVNAVEMVFISASNELGAFESGVAAALIGAVPAVVLGGAATVAIAAAWAVLFRPLREVDRLDELRPAPVAS